MAEPRHRPGGSFGEEAPSPSFSAPPGPLCLPPRFSRLLLQAAARDNEHPDNHLLGQNTHVSKILYLGNGPEVYLKSFTDNQSKHDYLSEYVRGTTNVLVCFLINWSGIKDLKRKNWIKHHNQESIPPFIPK